jgi:hypothetical protein
VQPTKAGLISNHATKAILVCAVSSGTHVIHVCLPILTAAYSREGSNYIVIYMCSQAVTVCSFSPDLHFMHAQGESFVMRRNCNCNCHLQHVVFLQAAGSGKVTKPVEH